jgi:hypothetical protein
MQTLLLALGETAHTHVLHAKKIVHRNVNDPNMDDVIEFMLEGTGVIRHEEHDKIVLSPGKYRKYPQMEFDPFLNTHRAVFD